MLLRLIPLTCSILLSLAVGVAVYPRKIYGARAFAFVAFSQAFITAAYIMELIVPTLAAKVFWDDMQYLFVFSGAAMYLVFGLTYASGPPKHPRMLAVSLTVVPLVFMLLIALDPYIGLYRPIDAFLIPAQPFDVLMYDLSPLAWLMSLYTNLLILGAILYLLGKLFSISPAFRLSTALIIFSMLLPLLSQALGFLGFSAQRDVTPYAFGLSNLLIGYVLLRGTLINLSPLAHSVAFENMRDVNLVFSESWRLIDYNQVAGEMLAERFSNPFDLSIEDLCPQYGDRIEQLKQMANTEKFVSFILSGEGDDHVELLVFPIRARGKLMGYSVLMHDISDRVRLERERSELIEHLDSYAHTVAHDIKNPLNTIMWGIYELTHADENQLSPQRRADVLAALEYTTNKAIEITESMLLLGSIQHDEDLKTGPMALRECVEESVGRLDHAVQTLNAQISIVGEDWPEVIGYESWVEQAIHNLIENALKYGGTPPVIEVSWQSRPAGFIRCCVKDNGPGLSDEEKAVAFLPFKRFSDRPVSGQGLGLSIVQRITARLGGQAGIDDAEGGGAIFWLELPEASAAPKGMEDHAAK